MADVDDNDSPDKGHGSWFMVKLLTRCQIDGKYYPHALSDEHIHLVRAVSEKEALASAERIGIEDECDYLNDTGETASWRFIGVIEVEALGTDVIEDGAEVYSCLTRTPEDVSFPRSS